MTVTVGPQKQSGNKVWHQVTASTPSELNKASKQVNAPIHGKGNQQPHLDVKPKQAEVLVQKGAVKQD